MYINMLKTVSLFIMGEKNPLEIAYFLGLKILSNLLGSKGRGSPFLKVPICGTIRSEFCLLLEANV